MQQQPTSNDPGIDWFIGLAGFLVTFALAGLLQSVRSDIGSTNVALLLTLVVVAAGVVGRRRGALTTALGAALSFNFFHTLPIHSLRIASARDVATVGLLLAIGLVVGELSRHQQRAAAGSKIGRVELGMLHTSAELSNSRPSPSAAIFDATAAIASLLGADAVCFERHPNTVGIPRGEIAHNGTLEGIALRATPEGYDLGTEPLAIRVANGAVLHGHMIVTPHPGQPVSLDARLGAVIIADHLALALSIASRASEVASV